MRAVVLTLLLAAVVGGSARADAGGDTEVRLITPREAPSIAEGSVVLRVSGMLDAATSDAALAALGGVGPEVETLIVHIDSHGGGSTATRRIIERLRSMVAGGVRLRTLVHQGDTCASACLLVFLQGSERYAGNASAWGFHGACAGSGNVPAPWATRLFVSDLAAAGVSPAFLRHLDETGCLAEPGVYWLSGYELREVWHAGIITHLIPAWQPEFPRPGR